MMLLRHVLSLLVLSFCFICGCVGAAAESDVLQETESTVDCSDGSDESNCRREEKQHLAASDPPDIGTSRAPDTNTELNQELSEQMEQKEQGRMQEGDRIPGRPEGNKVQVEPIIPNSSGRSTTEDNHELGTNTSEVTDGLLPQASEALHDPKSPSSLSPTNSGSTQGTGGGASHVEPGNSDHPQDAGNQVTDDSKRENPHTTDNELKKKERRRTMRITRTPLLLLLKPIQIIRNLINQVLHRTRHPLHKILNQTPTQGSPIMRNPRTLTLPIHPIMMKNQPPSQHFLLNSQTTRRVMQTAAAVSAVLCGCVYHY
ncbi:uncharacterized protein TM35_000581140 [Trypanosoma theileri]|uniref:Mucin TcMUCII n=1 Tax=Trypanosoma theileri TaxID=67003 RepID=A0A1X0NGN4_9TRYP|nr:uncharacterized protein TM35_000581140 [Trypanosoma theileri]ORC83751.1 hypothetical protein TM35_000581140 [Trypanosoma theileri]